MDNKQWLDLNEINDYIESEVGENNISGSTLRRWIAAESALSGEDATKTFANAGMGSKKPVTKYRLDVVNNMITHNLSRIQKKVTTALAPFDTPIAAGDFTALQRLLTTQQGLLTQMQQEAKDAQRALQQSLDKQLWLGVMKLQLDYDNEQRSLDGQSLFALLRSRDVQLDQVDINRFITYGNDTVAGRAIADSMRQGQAALPNTDKQSFGLADDDADN